MDDKPKPTPGDIWEREGEDFIIVQTAEIKTKAPSDANWSDAIAYRRVDMTGPLCIRQAEDFLAKFDLKGAR